MKGLRRIIYCAIHFPLSWRSAYLAQPTARKSPENKYLREPAAGNGWRVFSCPTVRTQDEEYIQDRIREALKYLELNDSDSVAMVLRELDDRLEIMSASHDHDIGWDVLP